MSVSVEFKQDSAQRLRPLVGQEASAAGGGHPGKERLYGCFSNLGVSFEWHDFKTSNDLDWGRSFQPDSLAICLNLSGGGTVGVGRTSAEYAPIKAVFTARGRLRCGRAAPERSITSS